MALSGYPAKRKPSYMPKCETIVHHKQHAYDEHGKVIVVDIADEDRQEAINSYRDVTGLKNVLAQLSKTGDVLAFRSMAYDGETEAVDTSGIPTNINDLKEAAETADARVLKALDDFNKATGMNLTLEQFNEMVNNGTIIDSIIENNNKAAATKEGEE